MNGRKDGRQVNGSRNNRMLHYGYNTTCTHNICGEVHYGYKVSEPGTYITLRIVIATLLDGSYGNACVTYMKA